MERVVPHGTSHVLTVLGRLHRIAKRLEDGKWIIAQDLAGEEEVSIKTIYRMLDFLRDQLCWDLEVSRIGFRLREKGQQPVCLNTNSDIRSDHNVAKNIRQTHKPGKIPVSLH
jgi:Predicted transcriptional regulator